MKIQIEISDKDLSLLAKVFNDSSSKSYKSPSSTAAQKILNVVKSKIDIAITTFNELKNQLAPFTDGSTVLLTSDFRTQLGISAVFIKSNNGLIAILNYVLKLLITTYKPEAKPIVIKKEKIDDAKAIQDLVNLIIANYEISQ